jgi:hypothetical protein
MLMSSPQEPHQVSSMPASRASPLCLKASTASV